MDNAPILEVRLDKNGAVTYTLRTSLLDTRMYGVILATLADYIATMMGQEGGFDRVVVKAQIVDQFNHEIEEPTKPLSAHMLQ